MVAIRVPRRFRKVRYNASRFPGSAGTRGLDDGANCQHFAYELLRHFGYEVPDLRSSNLWNDRHWTVMAKRLRPLDIVLFNRTRTAWGAHVGVYLGGGKIIHLCKQVGVPAIWTLARFAREDRYSVFLGAKRLRRKPSKP
jgi:cell wall-associated NlpC family hydrolase